MNVQDDDKLAFSRFLVAYNRLMDVVETNEIAQINACGLEIIQRNRLLDTLDWLYTRAIIASVNPCTAVYNAVCNNGPDEFSLTANRQSIVDDMCSEIHFRIKYLRDEKCFVIYNGRDTSKLEVNSAYTRTISLNNGILRDMFYSDVIAPFKGLNKPNEELVLSHLTEVLNLPIYAGIKSSSFQ